MIHHVKIDGCTETSWIAAAMHWELEERLPFTSWWLNHPFEKYAQVKVDHFPK